jgi:hypothetical protein
VLHKPRAQQAHRLLCTTKAHPSSKHVLPGPPIPSMLTECCSVTGHTKRCSLPRDTLVARNRPLQVSPHTSTDNQMVVFVCQLLGMEACGLHANLGCSSGAQTPIFPQKNHVARAVGMPIERAALYTPLKRCQHTQQNSTKKHPQKAEQATVPGVMVRQGIA